MAKADSRKVYPAKEPALSPAVIRRGNTDYGIALVPLLMTKSREKSFFGRAREMKDSCADWPPAAKRCGVAYRRGSSSEADLDATKVSHRDVSIALEWNMNSLFIGNCIHPIEQR